MSEHPTLRQLDTVIAQSHEIDDLCKQVARLKHANELAAILLQDVVHMITNSASDVAIEYVERAQSALSKVS